MLSPFLNRVGLSVTIFLILGLSGVTFAQTRQYLDAKVVSSQIVVQWNTGAKTMQFALDDDPTFRNVGPDTLFLAKQGVYVTYPSLNPLVVQASASATAVEDPGFTAISKLIDAITSVVGTVAPPSLSSGTNMARLAPTGPCSDPAGDIGGLAQLLYGRGTQPDALKTQFASWVKSINDAYGAGQSGSQAVDSAVDQIKDASKALQANVEAAKTKLAILQNCKDTAVYAAALLADPSVRIQQLSDIATALAKLADLLKSQYVDSQKWTGAGKRNFIISNQIDATFDKMQNVTVKVVNIAFNVNSPSLDQSLAGSATFSIRKYSLLTPEIGVGAVFATVTAPVYGTAQNGSGQIIVAKKPSTSLSVNPTILVNFVCRCGTGLLTPMAQVGAAVSKTTPALLLGGGIRLFALSKGNIAVGGGAMFAWVKDLQKLKVGDVIGGTNDINSDLAFNGVPKVGGYFAIQYKF